MQKKKEVEVIVNRYFSDKKNEICYCGNSTKIKQLQEILSNLKGWDCPDGYSRLDDEFVIFEHFEFDSSNRLNKVGSIQRIELAKDNELFSKVIESLGEEKTKSHHNIIKAEYTMANYIENLTAIFQAHHSKIPQYKANLIANRKLNDGENVTTMFFIEDTTLFGNNYETDGWERTVGRIMPVFCDFFIELFEKSLNVDCVICASQNLTGGHELWYMDRENADAYKQNMINTKDISIINFKPHIIDFAAICK